MSVTLAVRPAASTFQVNPYTRRNRGKLNPLVHAVPNLGAGDMLMRDTRCLPHRTCLRGTISL